MMTGADSRTRAVPFSSASNEMLAAILDQSADCIKVIGIDGTVDYMNRNGQCAMEIDDFCAIAGQRWTSLWPEAARPKLEAALQEAREGRTSQFEEFCPTAKGSPRWWEVTVSPLLESGVELVGFVSTSRDISDRILARDAADAITAEMRHRLRNNYVVVGSLLLAYARGNPDREAFVQEMIERLNALGVAQTMRGGAEEPCLLCDLVPALLAPYGTPDCAIRIGALPTQNLGQGQVDAFALVLGELAVNATKHGALSAHGHVSIDAAMVEDVIELRWSERSDVKVTSQARSGGQGLRLMQRLIAARRGTFDILWCDNGLDVTIRLPAS